MENMESDISEAKLHTTLKTMENKKSPDEVGDPAEFYKVSAIDINGMMFVSYRYAKGNELLSTTQRGGIISTTVCSWHHYNHSILQGIIVEYPWNFWIFWRMFRTEN